MPLPICLVLLFLCSMAVFALAYTQGRNHYELENIGKPITLQNIMDVHGLSLFCKEFTTLYCLKVESNCFLCLARNSQTGKVYYFSFDNDPGEFFTLYVKENKSKKFEAFIKPSL